VPVVPAQTDTSDNASGKPTSSTPDQPAEKPSAPDESPDKREDSGKTPQ
jgi:hypothetical protein